MHFLAVLNKDGGTLRTTDLDAFTRRMRATLEGAGHTVEVDVVEGKDVVEALSKASRSRKADVVLAGGGDGTISAAASVLTDNRKALAILPAGTMNLFARSLEIPLTLDAAIDAFAHGEIREIDIASADGRPFVHQFSIGMHAKMVVMREKMEFGSRLGKIQASARAAWATFRNPPELKVSLTIGEAEIIVRTTGIGVTNNLFGEGHLPYAEDPAGGVLGIYVTIARQRHELLHFFWNMARGRWRGNQQVEIHQAERATLKILSSNAKYRCVMDGELETLRRETIFEIHPKALKVLVPVLVAGN